LSATLTAQMVLDENNYTKPSLAIGESLIDKSIDYVNLLTGRHISFMAGTAGSKTCTLLTGEYSVVHMLASLMFRAYNDKSPNITLGSLSVNLILQDPQFALFKPAIDEGIVRLRGRGILRTFT
jgi:hypothetical protein